MSVTGQILLQFRRMSLLIKSVYELGLHDIQCWGADTGGVW